MVPPAITQSPKTSWAGALGLCGAALVALGALLPGRSGQAVLLAGGVLNAVANSAGNLLSKDGG